jgi:hypothetical protein
VTLYKNLTQNPTAVYDSPLWDSALVGIVSKKQERKVNLCNLCGVLVIERETDAS